MILTITLEVGASLQTGEVQIPEDSRLTGVLFVPWIYPGLSTDRFRFCVSTSGLSAAEMQAPSGGSILAYAFCQRVFQAGTTNAFNWDPVIPQIRMNYPLKAGQILRVQSLSSSVNVCRLTALLYLDKEPAKTLSVPESRDSGKISLRNPVFLDRVRSSDMSSKVITLAQAREAMLSALGQLLGAAGVIAKNAVYFATIQVSEAIGAPTILPYEMAQLLDVYAFADGYNKLKEQRTHLGSLVGGTHFDADFKGLEDSPLELGVAELFDRALGQKTPRIRVDLPKRQYRLRDVKGARK
jgi:hypothetical protein